MPQGVVVVDDLRERWFGPEQHGGDVADVWQAKRAAFEVAASELNLEESFTVHTGIAHARLATHGEPAPKNSHPQTSGLENDFVVVHNRVITNYEVFVRHGFTFESDTDTEVIPKLAKYVFDKANEGEGVLEKGWEEVGEGFGFGVWGGFGILLGFQRSDGVRIMERSYNVVVSYT
ncbi:hypothetical protein Cgig2_018949 [Carnegiea gigantea]|uniref:glutamine--fructose-6-phosphate transaminase (isomerizing) n=1 Tax=Carnegiea gigantea TaxID=171969 RepID=A0A9Q1GPR8_9CARY|nr:hypothetical protein Cgig2_018949 [Carnegiea gigantea]